MAGKKVFLSGGNGFIGRNLIEQLGKRHEITAPGRKELDLLDADAVERFLKNGGFDVAIHAANIGGNRRDPGPPNMAELNMRMFFNIARCKEHFGKMIQFGSGAEYGKQADIRMAKEEDFGKRVPSDSYGFYKYVCSRHVEGNGGITCLRIFGCYGKYEDYEYKFISNAICKALCGMPVTINNKNVVFSYLYIDDFVRIVDHFIAHDGKQRFYNVAPDETADLVSIAKTISEISDEKPQVVVKNPGFGLEYTGSNARLKAEMKGIRFTGMKDGIKSLYGWYKNNKGRIDKRKLDFTG